MMFEQTIYTFLLRRLLGPILTEKSRQKLSDCIEVSLQDGTFVLKDVELDPNHVNSQIGSGGGEASTTAASLVFRRIRISKLEILLSMGSGGSGGEIVDNNNGRSSSGGIGVGLYKMSAENKSSSSWSSSFSNAATKRISNIKATVNLSGVRVDLGPNETEIQWRTTTTSTAAFDGNNSITNKKVESHIHHTSVNNGSTKGGSNQNSFFSSCINAALSSLRVNVNDVSLRIFGGSGSSMYYEGEESEDVTFSSSTSPFPSWIRISLSSIRYYNKASKTTPTTTTGTATTTASGSRTTHNKEQQQETSVRMEQVIEFSGFMIQLQSSNSHRSCFTDSHSRESMQNNSTITTGTSTRWTADTIVASEGIGQISFRSIPESVQKDIHVSLEQRFVVTMDPYHVGTILQIFQKLLHTRPRPNNPDLSAITTSTSLEKVIEEEKEDETGILEVFPTGTSNTTNSNVVNNNHTTKEPPIVLRGGLLLPRSTSPLENDDSQSRQTNMNNGASLNDNNNYLPPNDIVWFDEPILTHYYSDPSSLKQQHQQKNVNGDNNVGTKNQVKDDNSNDDEDEFDMFFDCNDSSFSVYLSFVKPPSSEQNSVSSATALKQRVSFHLTELSIQLLLGIPSSSSPSPSTTGNYKSSPLPMMELSLADLNVTQTTSKMESKCFMELSHLEIDYSFFVEEDKKQQTQPNSTAANRRFNDNKSRRKGSLLRFIEEDCDEEDDSSRREKMTMDDNHDAEKHDTVLVSSPPCLSLEMKTINLIRRGQQVSQEENDDNNTNPPYSQTQTTTVADGGLSSTNATTTTNDDAVETSINVDVLPIELYLPPEMIHALSKASDAVQTMVSSGSTTVADWKQENDSPANDFSASSSDVITPKRSYEKTTFQCHVPSIVVLVPLFSSTMHEHHQHAADELLQRGYHVYNDGSSSLSSSSSCCVLLGLEVMRCTLLYERYYRRLRPGEHVSKQDMTTYSYSTNVQNIQVFARQTTQKRKITPSSNNNNYSNVRNTQQRQQQLVSRRSDFLTLSLLSPGGSSSRGRDQSGSTCGGFKLLELSYEESSNVVLVENDGNTRNNANHHSSGSANKNDTATTPSPTNRYYTNIETFHHFPMVRPISAIKASQDQEGVAAATSSSASNSLTNSTAGRRSEHPQWLMVKQAERCNKLVDVLIPHFIIDLSVSEKSALLYLVNEYHLRVFGSINKSSSSKEQQKEETFKGNNKCTENLMVRTTTESSPPRTPLRRMMAAISIKCHRFTMFLHPDNDEEYYLPLKNGTNMGANTMNFSKESPLSFIFDAEGIRIHSVLNGCVTQCRCIAHDFAFYSAKQKRSKTTPDTAERVGISKRNNKQQTMIKSLSSLFDEVTATFFRSKLGKPLSSDIPSFLFDITLPSVSHDVDNHNDDDVSVHVSLYNVTHRYDIKESSHWMEQFGTLLKGMTTTTTPCCDSDKLDNDATSDQENNNVDETAPTTTATTTSSNVLTKIFLTLTDCNVDYTSPTEFQLGVRSIIRMGEVRITGMIEPSSRHQTFKVSLADLSFMLNHVRVPHTIENTHLVGATAASNVGNHGRFVQVTKGGTTTTATTVAPMMAIVVHDLPFEDALIAMEFVPILFVSSTDISIEMNHSRSTSSSDEESRTTNSSSSKTPPASMTLDTTVGQVDLYVCRDSFQCFANMMGDISLYLTALNEEEARKKQLAHEEDSSGAIDGSSSQRRKGENERRNNNGSSKKQAPIPHYTDCVTTTAEDAEIADMNAQKKKKEDFETKVLRKMILDGVPRIPNTNANPLSHVPDSELSASDLRKKYDILAADEPLSSTTIAKSKLIKNYYSLEMISSSSSSSPSSQKKSGSTNNSPRNGTTTASRTNNSHRRSASSTDKVEVSTNDGSTFLLDGHDWITVDHEWIKHNDITLFNDETEQRTEWFPANTASTATTTKAMSSSDAQAHASSSTMTNGLQQIQIFPNHLAFDSVRDPLSQGDMDSTKLTKLVSPPKVQLRVLVRDLSSFNCRFFDGYDWITTSTGVRSPNSSQKKGSKSSFANSDQSEVADGSIIQNSASSKQNELMDQLLQHGNSKSDADVFSGNDDLFEFDQKSGSYYKKNANLPSVPKIQQRRQEDKFFEVSVSGLQMRLDSFEMSCDHKLASCMNLKVMDFFISESISSRSTKTYPTKLLGELIDVKLHPRDANDGMIMMNLVTMHPPQALSPEGRLCNPESEATLELLPLRAHIDQHALRFILNFFSSSSEDDNDNTDEGANKEDDNDISTKPTEIQTFFKSFHVKSCKLKVDYKPIGVDPVALREGSYTELLNLFTLENMSLQLKPAKMQNLLGWGPVISELIKNWIDDICTNQLHKFVSGATPFHPISNVGGSAADLVLMPVRYYKNDRRKLSLGVRKSTQSFAQTVAVETLNTTSKVTKTLAHALDKASPAKKKALSLPHRPDRVPRRVSDTAHHAIESLSRGLKASTYMIVVVPRKEYKKHGTASALKSAVQGIPVALLAPISGASEALSYTLVGIRNQIKPDLRREEEARRAGLRPRNNIYH